MSDEKTITRLLSYRIARASGSLSRGAAARYRREFDVSLGEWRVLALLGQDPGLGVNRLARRAALDKAQLSRVVSKLESRGLLRRTAGPRRSSLLFLTPEGERTYRGLISAANERDRRIFAQVDPAKMAVFEEVLEQVSQVGRDMELEETNENTNSASVDNVNRRG